MDNKVVLLGYYGGDERHCFDSETEILTEKGWTYFKSLTGYERVASTSDDLDIIDFVKPLAYIERYVDEELIHIENQGIDILCTTDHRFLIKNRYQKKQTKLAKELVDTKVLFSIPVGLYTELDKIQLDNFYKLVGFFLGDGHLTSNQLHFHLKKQRKIDYLYSLGYVVTKILQDKYVISLTKEQVDYFNCLYNEENCKILPNWFDYSNKLVSLSVIDGMLNSDGTQKNNTYSTTSYILANQYQALLASVGLNSTIKKHLDTREGNRKPLYVVYYKKRNIWNNIYPNKHISKKHYKGYVFCVTVPLGNIIIRRNNKIAITKNCISAWQSTNIELNIELTENIKERINQLYEATVVTKKKSALELLQFLAQHNHCTPFEKSCLDFQITGDIGSHIHTIKHRIATSINSESARYKELTDKWYLPNDWKYIYPDINNIVYNNRDLHWWLHLTDQKDKDWHSILNDFTTLGHLLYHQAVKDLTDVLGRKRAKESARYFLTYNKQLDYDCMFNFRSFVHFQQLRNSEHAQLEIQQIAQQMLELVKSIPGNPFKYSLEAFNL